MRSLLFVPAKEKMLKKIKTFTADGYILDLEDSITSEEKDQALTELIKYLSLETIPENTFVRLDNELLDLQIKELSKFDIQGFMLPKFESIAKYSVNIEYLINKRNIALIETPKGVLNAAKIAECDWINAIAFGAEDYTAFIGMVNNRENLLMARSLLIIAGKANRIKIYDTPSFILNDEANLKAEVQYSVDMGFDGKLAINPKQIPIINDVYNQIDIAYLKEVIAQYEENKEAVQIIDGKVYEKMHISHMKRILKERNVL